MLLGAGLRRLAPKTTMGVNGPLAATLPMFKAIAPFFRSDAACLYKQQSNSHVGVEEGREETVGKSTEQSINRRMGSQGSGR